MTLYDVQFKHMKNFDRGTVFRYKKLKWIVLGFVCDDMVKEAIMYFTLYDNYPNAIDFSDVQHLYVKDNPNLKKVDDIDKDDLDTWLLKLRITDAIGEHILKLSDKEKLKEHMARYKISTSDFICRHVLPLFLGIWYTGMYFLIKSTKLYLISGICWFIVFILNIRRYEIKDDSETW